MLKIDRLESTELGVEEDPTIYTEDECQELLCRIHVGNMLTGGLKFVTKCYGIVGNCNICRTYQSQLSCFSLRIITFTYLFIQVL